MVAAGNGGQAQVPQLNVAAQYIKDFSFENPNAPRSLTTPTQQPAIDIKIRSVIAAIMTFLHPDPGSAGKRCTRGISVG